MPIYLDHQATTPVDPTVREAMMPYWSEEFGNASSSNHPFGWKAEKAVEKARGEIADFLGAEPKEILFTSGATEANNLAIKGVFQMYRDKGDHLITQATEHKSVLDTCRFLERHAGAKVTYLPVDSFGRINTEDLEQAITDETVIISVMLANNEIGTLQPIQRIGEIAKARGVFFHCDGAQAVGKIPVNVEKLGIDLLSASAHKVYGPKGIGMLYVRKKNPRVRLVPLLHGGGQEQDLRSGTLNVPGIVGFAKALEIVSQSGDREAERIRGLRNRLYEKITEYTEDVFLNGHPEEGLPGNLNLSFAAVEGEALLMGISENIAVSSGSACTSAKIEPSYVLKALGLREELIHASVRYGIGRFNTEEEIDFAAGRTAEMVKRLREISPLYSSGAGKSP